MVEPSSWSGTRFNNKQDMVKPSSWSGTRFNNKQDMVEPRSWFNHFCSTGAQERGGWTMSARFSYFPLFMEFDLRTRIIANKKEVFWFNTITYRGIHEFQMSEVTILLSGKYVLSLRTWRFCKLQQQRSIYF